MVEENIEETGFDRNAIFMSRRLRELEQRVMELEFWGKDGARCYQGELVPWLTKARAQIAYQQSPHIDSGIRTHDLVSYELIPYQLDQSLLVLSFSLTCIFWVWAMKTN
ncbi:hypothetical protein PIB30_060032 [Stylosanthes scabra]|uniref:Uncharacterized protein n=1 Tax=Stylosanthes scabra TaxID=79078 RepID=A0ABU6RLA9_9FABA|nr:hypothetical protein [Stylosanthes scabra]